MDFHHFSEIDDSDSNSRKKGIITHIGVLWSWTAVNSGIGTIAMTVPIQIPIPATNGIKTTLVRTEIRNMKHIL